MIVLNRVYSHKDMKKRARKIANSLNLKFIIGGKEKGFDEFFKDSMFICDPPAYGLSSFYSTLMHQVIKQTEERAMAYLTRFYGKDTRRNIFGVTKQEREEYFPNGSKFARIVYDLSKTNWLFPEREYSEGELNPIIEGITRAFQIPGRLETKLVLELKDIFGSLPKELTEPKREEEKSAKEEDIESLCDSVTGSFGLYLPLQVEVPPSVEKLRRFITDPIKEAVNYAYSHCGVKKEKDRFIKWNDDVHKLKKNVFSALEIPLHDVAETIGVRAELDVSRDPLIRPLYNKYQDKDPVFLEEVENYYSYTIRQIVGADNLCYALHAVLGDLLMLHDKYQENPFEKLMDIYKLGLVPIGIDDGRFIIWHPKVNEAE